MSNRIATVLSASVIALSMLVVPAAQSANGVGPDKVVVSTDNGPVRGTVGTTTSTFLGIPYAQPPVGDLRWEPPKQQGRRAGILDADHFAPHCPQPLGSDQSNSSEDCLYLNVYVPRDLDLQSNSASALHSSHVRLPVMVWIYGGANAIGASEFYDPTPLVETGGVVAVTVNYRVGPFGFLAHPALDAEGHAAVNYGVMDQQAALRWIKNNIDKFGGDQNKVTIFGESAGGLNVTTHLVSPLSAGLFDLAIIESGAYQLNTPSLAASEARGIAFASRVGCTDQTATCLRSKTTAEILASAGTVNTAGAAYNQSTVDGQILAESQISALTAGRINRVPVLQGANSHEGRAFTPPTITAAQFQAALVSFALAFGKDPAVALATYPLADYPSPFEAYSAMLGDFAFACSAKRSNQLLAQVVPTYAYEFGDENAGPLGATHGAEIKYLFNIVGVGSGADGGPSTLPPASQQLALAMRQYWTTFAASGNPNEIIVPPWLPASPFFDSVQLLTPPLPHFDTTFAYGTRHKCSFWL
jgi:para-nitrobenzyl esterase